MPITHNSEQSQELEDFYQEAANHEAQRYASAMGEHLPGVGYSMLQLLARINKMFPIAQLWGLTSHYRLVIQNADDWRADWLILIAAGLDGSYIIDYLLPPPLRPWPSARVRGEAKTLAEAERYLLIAMRECQGWKGNTELATLLKQYNLDGS